MIKQFKQLDENDLTMNEDATLTNALVRDMSVNTGRKLGLVVADKLQYYRESERVVAEGGVEMISLNGDYLSSDSIDVHVPTQIGTLKNSQFKLARGISSARLCKVRKRGLFDVSRGE